MDEDEKLFIKFVKDSYRLSTGTELEEWKEDYILTMYRFNKQHPFAKIVMGRKGPVVLEPKEEKDDRM